jgi:uncharacterized protein (TIGR03067 family)
VKEVPVTHRSLTAALLAGVVFVLGLSLAEAVVRQKADPKADHKRLEGKWKVWRSEQSGRITADSGDGMIIEGNDIQFLWNGNNKGGTATFTLKPGNPGQIDLEHTTGRWIGKKQLGIYRFTAAGQLEISWAEPGVGKRPTRFSGKLTPGAGNPMVIYRSAAYKLPAAITREFKALEGKWNLVEYHRLGRAEPNTRGRREGMLIEDDDIQYTWGGNNKGGKARFLVDPSKNPRHIEVVYTVGSERYKKRIGIYKLTGNKLQMTLSAPDSSTRPTAFSGIRGTRGAGDAYYVYEREKD